MKKFVNVLVAMFTVGMISFMLYYEYRNFEFDDFSNVAFSLGGIQTYEPNIQEYTKLVKDIGLNTIEVTHYAKQGEWDSDNLQFDGNISGLIQEITTAKSLGMQVVMILRVTLMEDYKRNAFYWHGMILPRDELLDSWFEKYEKLVLKWAKICQDLEVDAFVIGSELNALVSTRPIRRLPKLYQYYLSDYYQKKHEGRILQYIDEIKNNPLWERTHGNYNDAHQYVLDKIDAQKKWAKQVCYYEDEDAIEKINVRRRKVDSHWRRIIKMTRDIYSGSISYAANFDNYQDVNFWEELDFIGINAYFPLLENNSLGNNQKDQIQKIKNTWRSHFFDIKRFMKSNDLLDKYVIFTELGYINRQKSLIEPWKGFGYSILGNGSTEEIVFWQQQAIDQYSRANALWALGEAIQEDNFPLKGVLYWKLTGQKYNLEYEPFALLLRHDNPDPLQNALISLMDTLK